MLVGLAAPSAARAMGIGEAMSRLGIDTVRLGQLRLSGVTGESRLERIELARELDGGLRLGAARATAGLLPLGPVELRGRLEEAGGRLRWSGEARVPGGNRLGRVSVSLDARNGGATVTVDAPDIVLGAGGVAVRDLVPALAASLEQVGGRVGIRARLELGRRPAESLVLLLDDLSFGLAGARVERLNGVVRLAGLRPPRTGEPQELAVALIDAGLPLTSGLVRFELRRDGVLAIDRLGLEVAGGRIEAAGVELSPPYRAGRVRLTAEGLDLGALVDALTVPDLEASGRLDGELPIELADDGSIEVTGGRLAARAPGVIRWRPAEPPAGLAAAGAGADILLQALRDFRYDSLEMTLDGQTDGEMRARLSIKGRNPDLHDGYPIELNLNLDGQLGAIVRRGVRSWQMPDAIARRIREFRRPGG